MVNLQLLPNSVCSDWQEDVSLVMGILGDILEAATRDVESCPGHVTTCDVASGPGPGVQTVCCAMQ